MKVRITATQTSYYKETIEMTDDVYNEWCRQHHPKDRDEDFDVSDFLEGLPGWNGYAEVDEYRDVEIVPVKK